MIVDGGRPHVESLRGESGGCHGVSPIWSVDRCKEKDVDYGNQRKGYTEDAGKGFGDEAGRLMGVVSGHKDSVNVCFGGLFQK